MATSIINRGLIQREWGEHGWDPDLASMKAIFLITGPGIRGGLTIPEVQNVDVYPLMTELLGLQPGGRTGRAAEQDQVDAEVRGCQPGLKTRPPHTGPQD